MGILLHLWPFDEKPLVAGAYWRTSALIWTCGEGVQWEYSGSILTIRHAQEYVFWHGGAWDGGDERSSISKGQVMDDQRSLVYHQATLDLLHERPSVSEDAVELLGQFSPIYDLMLPASVREWYELPQAVTWLRTYSNEDHPVPLELLGDIDGFGDDAVDLAQQGVIPIMIENQNVCIWALQLNGADDPPVVVSFGATTGWQPYAERFSTFVYVRIWDYQGLFSDYTLWGDALFSSDELSFLQAHFTEEPQTLTHPTPLTRRFSRGTQRILLWCDDEPMAQWFLSAATEEEWSQLRHTMESCETLAQHLPQFQPFDS